MKRLFVFAALIAVAMSPNSASAQLNNVFGAGQKTEATKDAADFSLEQLLTEAGYKVEVDGGKCSMQIKMGTITYPAMVYATKNRKAVWFVVGLDSVPANASDFSDKLLKLLERGGGYGPIFYSYSSKTRLISLLSTLDAADVTAGSLDKRLDVMIAQADEEKVDWMSSQWIVARHVGSWSASLGQKASVKINLRSDGSFDLTNKTEDNTTEIKGQYKLADGKLEMKDSEGNEIAGDIRFVNGNEFKLTVNNEDLSFERS